MEYQTGLPLLYRKPIPLNSVNHAETTIGPSPGGYAFAAAAHSVILAGVEFGEACRHFPILFAASEKGPVVPVALMGLQSGENLFVGSTGEWQAGYLPAYIRRYPFISTEGEDAARIVCIDETYDGLNREGGQLLFEGAEPGPYLQKVLEFLNDFLVQIQHTETFCRQLQEMGLLKPMNAQIELVDGRQFNLTDFQIIDEQKLQEIDGAALEVLFRSGWLSWIHAHGISMRSLQGLLDRKAAMP